MQCCIDIVNAFKQRGLHMLCLSELGELDKGIGGELQATAQQWMAKLLADSAAQLQTTMPVLHSLALQQHLRLTGLLT